MVINGQQSNISVTSPDLPQSSTTTVNTLHSFPMSSSSNVQGEGSGELGFHPNKIAYTSGPCKVCKIPIQKGSQFIGVVGIILGVILTACGGVALGLQSYFLDEHNKYRPTKDAAFEKCLYEYSALVNLIRGFYDIVLHIILLVGVQKENMKVCIAFIVVKLILLNVLIITSLVLAFVFESDYFYIPMIPLILIPYEVYALFVVFSYVDELKIAATVPAGIQSPPQRDSNVLENTDIFTSGAYGSPEPGGPRPATLRPPQQSPTPNASAAAQALQNLSSTAVVAHSVSNIAMSTIDTSPAADEAKAKDETAAKSVKENQSNVTVIAD